MLALVAAAVLGAAPLPLAAQVTPQVPLESPTYQRIDALLSAGLGGHVVVGQRPYSRMMVADIVVAARSLLAARGSAGSASQARLERIVSQLEREYAPEIAARGTGRIDAPRPSIERTGVELLALDSPPRPINDVGLGSVDAATNPLAAGRAGRDYVHGLNAAVEGAAAQAFGRRVAAAASARISAEVPRGELLTGSITAGARNVVVQAGRVPIRYGQGIEGGMFASRNAAAPDMIRIASDRPAYLPSVLRRLGPAQGSLFIADLGGASYFPHTKLVGWKVSLLPHRSLEMGASLLSIQGGDGAPPARFGERVIDVLTIIDVLVFQDRDLLFSNKLAGVDLRARMPRAEAYLDLLLDDFDTRRIAGSLWEDAGFTAGVVVPELGRDGSVRLEAEYQHTGLRYYQHGQFKSGVAVRGHLLGVPLGPRADALVGRVTWDPARRHTLQVTGWLEQRSDDRYVTYVEGADDSGWQFIKTEDRPEERRARLMVGSAMTGLPGNTRLEIDAGYERVVGDAFVPEARRNNLMARVAFVVDRS